MSSPQEIMKQELLAAHRRTLAHLLTQQAQFSVGFVPAHIANGIADARANIQRVKQTLHNWGVPIDDHPDDDTDNKTSSRPPAYKFMSGVDLSSQEAQQNILYVSYIIDARAENLERYFGPPFDVDIVNIGSLDDIPAGGELRWYNFDRYTLSIAYDKQYIAKSVRIEDLSEHGYRLYDWFEVLHRLGISITTQPDIISVISATWRDYHGYHITVALDKVDGVINIVRVFRVPA